MLSVRRCRELVGKECRLNDEELDVLRTQFYALARITFTEFENRANPRVGHSVHNFTKALRLVDEDERAAVEERAAIAEFDGNLPRDEAERAAIALTLRGSDS